MDTHNGRLSNHGEKVECNDINVEKILMQGARYGGHMVVIPFK